MLKSAYRVSATAGAVTAQVTQHAQWEFNRHTMSLHNCRQAGRLDSARELEDGMICCSDESNKKKTLLVPQQQLTVKFFPR
jgi:hypothetical protein